MIIQNYRDLAQSRLKKHTLQILESGLEAASPQIGLKQHLQKNKITVGGKAYDLDSYSGVYLVAFGKSAGMMAKTANSVLDIKNAIVVVPKGSNPGIRGKKFQILASTHPTPSQASVRAAKAIVKFLHGRKSSEFVLFLVSGGASSLLCLPDGIDLSDKIYSNDLLLKSGATIDEFNCVRKHLSKIKGGRLVENLSCDAVSLIMSDVVGNDPSVIASGTTYRDDTTFNDALRIISKYNLKKKFPSEALERLCAGARGEISETLKKDIIPNHVIATNQDCLDAMAHRARDLGYNTNTMNISGDIKDAVKKIKENIPKEPKSCLVFGGETTVRVIGNGQGGRNQEMVLRLLKNLRRIDGQVVIASVGTDGIDGNTKSAGALAESFEIDTAVVDSYLRTSNSGAFFAKFGGLVNTGYTNTNLMDIGIIMR